MIVSHAGLDRRIRALEDAFADWQARKSHSGGQRIDPAERDQLHHSRNPRQSFQFVVPAKRDDDLPQCCRIL